MDPLTVDRKGEVFSCNPARVITRFYAPGGGEVRIKRLVDRVLALPEEDCHQVLARTLKEFSSRHRDFETILLRNYQRVERYVPDPTSVSSERKLLLGAYFTQEYSVESAALFNPSIVPHPDQSNLPYGSVRFIISFRGIGEGHLSSIVFRSGVLDEKNNMTMDAMSPYVEKPAIERNPSYDKATFLLKVEDLGADRKVSEEILAPLPREFLFRELQERLQTVRNGAAFSVDLEHAASVMDWVARSNYEIVFREDRPISERVIFPTLEDESNGIEDARFVRFVDEDRDVRYYATYTAYNGRTILPMLIETRDFVRFKMCTLNGNAARNKGMALFPRKVNGLFTMISRQDGESLFLVQSENIRFWNDANVLHGPEADWELIQIGNCGSPIETREGWLLLTHGVGPLRQYCIGVELLDLEDPSRVIGRLEEPLIVPNEYEREGYVPNVAYTCGAMIHNDVLVIPYGVSDTATCVATVRLKSLLERLKRSSGGRG